MKIARLSQKMTMSDVKDLLKKLPWCHIKMINGQTWLVRCGMALATYPVVESIQKSSLLGV